MLLPPQRSAALAFFLAAALTLVAALLPWVRGRAPNAVFLSLTIVWFVLGVAMLRRGGGTDSDRAG